MLSYTGLFAPSGDELFGSRVNFEPGYYWAFVETDSYSQQRTPLDDALKTGLVRVERAVTIAPGSQTWILMRVLDGFGGKFAWFLGRWARWHKGKATIEQSAERSGVSLANPDDWKDVVLDVRRKAVQVGQDVSDWIESARKGLGKWIGRGLFIGGGLWLWSASRRRR